MANTDYPTCEFTGQLIPDIEFYLDQQQQEEIRKVVDRYIKKTNHKVFIVSTKKRNNKNVK